jgi:hypothetical protein
LSKYSGKRRSISRLSSASCAGRWLECSAKVLCCAVLCDPNILYHDPKHDPRIKKLRLSSNFVRGALQVYHKLLSTGCYHYISCCSLLSGSAVVEKIEKRSMEPGWSAVASLISDEWVGRVTVPRSKRKNTIDTKHSNFSKLVYLLLAVARLLARARTGCPRVQLLER